MTGQSKEVNFPELLAPAGDPERLRMAVHYGADAVYAGLKELSLRAGAANFSREQFSESVQFAHSRGVRVYATVNVFAHNEHLKKAPSLLHFLKESGVDALIISDPGIAELAREFAPGVPLHLSTQAGVTNGKSALFWFRCGFKRINLARELTLEEIKQVRQQAPGVELETFLHGAMCMAYSGRCLLSSYLTGRGANQGECTQPCRWRYLVEEYRPDEPLILEEDFRGSQILSSRDLCMIEHLPDLLSTGVQGLKIEGRMKTIHYVSTVTRVYRRALDLCKHSPESYQCKDDWKEELQKVSHRPYSTGFFYNTPMQVDPGEEESYHRKCILVGVVLDYDPATKAALVEQRNPFQVGDSLEVLNPREDPFTVEIQNIYNQEGEEVDRAPHPQQILKIPVQHPVAAHDLLRKYVEQAS